MKKFDRGQIWLVDFDPSFGHEYKKTKPALNIQQKQYIASGNLLTVIPVSLKTTKVNEFDVIEKKDPQNRLMKDSLLKTNQISSFDKRRFIKLIGIPNEEIMMDVDNNIRLFLFGA